MKKAGWFIYVFLHLTFGWSQTELFHFNNPLSSKAAALNPAFLPQYGLSFSVATSTQFTPGQIQIFDLFRSDLNAEETIRALLSDSSKDLKNLRFDQELGLLDIGIRSRRSYIHLSSKFIARTDLNLDKDLLGLVYLGNGDSQYYKKPVELDFSGTNFQMQMEHRMSYGRRIGAKWYLGVSAKVIHGLARLQLNRARFNLLTDESEESIYRLSVNGEVDAVSTGFQGSILKPYDPMWYLRRVPFANYGLAYGGGFVYRPFDFLRISFSTDNHGTSEWNYFRSTHNLKVDIKDFQGFDTLFLLANGAGRNIGAELSDTLDSWYSFKENMKFKREVTPLRPRYVFSAEYLGFRRHKLGFIYATGLGARSDIDLWSITEQFNVNKYIQLYAGYSRFMKPIPQNILNLGFSVQGLGMQLYGQLNNVIGLMDLGSKSHYYGGQVGININIVENIDSDGDDIPDHRDNCKEVFGVPRYKGCPEYTFRQPHLIDPKTKRLKKMNQIEERF
jgi:hypothetical protein